VIKSRIIGLAGHVARVRERRRVFRALVGKPEEETTWKTQAQKRKIILRGIFRKCNGGMEGIDLAQDRDRWRALVETVMNLQVP
jgi:hypothetical protein